MAEKKVVINLTISVEARLRLEELAKDTGWPMGVALEKAILSYQPGIMSKPAPVADRSESLNCLAALESIGIGPRLDVALQGINEILKVIAWLSWLFAGFVGASLLLSLWSIFS